jgi:protocatechuate 3,4-dioxygenase beta subunit
MKNRRLLVVGLLVAVVAVIVWLLLPREVATSPSETSEPTAEKTATSWPQTNVLPEVERQAVQSVARSHTAASRANADEAVRDYVANKLADPEYDWKQPINFYGKVVDENEQPVEGASAYLNWTDLSANGTSEYQTVSDASGLFSMENRKGKRLSVTASKAGYYSAADARLASFEYANPADGLFTPDHNHPVVFHLRKKGIGAGLLTSEYGFKKHLSVNAPLDDTAVGVDLLQRKINPEGGQLIIRQKKPPYENWKQATEWSFRIEIPGGGFVEHHDEFPFETPETGYEPVIQFIFQTGQPDWATAIRKDYYIKFGNPARYGRLHLETEITMAGARLTYAINPDGSRNLEPK